MEKNEKKSKIGSAILSIVCVIAIAAFTFSGYKVYVIEKGYHDAKVSYDTVSDLYTTVVDKENSGPDIEEVSSTVQVAKKVDFQQLRSEVNSDIIGWIYCPETVIDYPIVQGRDNEHYLYYNVNGHESASGTIFLETNNYPDFSDRNNVLHGHHMQSGAMFATLDRWQSQDYYNAHPVFYINAASGDNFIADVVAAFDTVDKSDVYKYEFLGQEDFDNWVEMIRSNSTITPTVQYSGDDHFVCLSTCSYGLPDGTERSVLILRLTKI